MLAHPWPSGRAKERAVGVERQIELTADSLWNDVAARLREALNDTTFQTWFGEVDGRGARRRRLRDRRPERLHARVDRRALPRPDPRSGARRPAASSCASSSASTSRAPPAAAPSAVPSSVTPLPLDVVAQAADAAGRGSRDQPEVHLRLVRDRLVQPFRARCGARRRRSAGPGLQPALHLRAHRASARPTCCTPSRTSSPTTAAGSPAATSPRRRS